MIEPAPDRLREPDSGSLGRPVVTDLFARRRDKDVICSITLVFGGVHYGTLPISAQYTRGKAVALYLSPQNGDDLSGPLDCLVTDDVALARDAELSR